MGEAQRVPAGFVEFSDDEVNPEGLPEAELLRELDRVPCVLHTDYSGSNYFVVEVRGVRLVLSVRTD